jgi:hypothetical protein
MTAKKLIMADLKNNGLTAIAKKLNQSVYRVTLAALAFA